MDDASTAVFGKVEDPAANVVRAKLHTIYADEPAAALEEQEILSSGIHSKHQKYMAKLMASGEDYATIQTEWHHYYEGLDDTEKHEVWQEFYEQKDRVQAPEPVRRSVDPNIFIADKPAVTIEEKAAVTMADLHKKIMKTVNANGKLKMHHHVKSFAFSMGFAGLVTATLFFVTNNEKFLVPFIQPSRVAAAAPIITDGTIIGPEAKIIIPKINLEAGVVDGVNDNSETSLWDALEKGVVIYPFTPRPGERGNSVLFGHSSNNIFNHGVAKFVFVRLHQLEIGDTYAVNYGGKQYVYKIFNRIVVHKDQVEYLYDTPRPVMSTLITCDPPGTGYYRLILQAEQISPDPNANVASTVAPPAEAKKPSTVPSNSPSLLKRLFGL
jgi:LPXTG-site transpeptidase (sortase) family protein